MCRLMICQPDTFPEKYFFHGALKELEESQGGDGNGLAVSTGGRIEIMKGLPRTKQWTATTTTRPDLMGPFTELKSISSWGWQVRKNADFMIYHTRMASQGVIDEGNCQPFGTERNFMAHNGHLDLAQDYHAKDSDSRLVYRMTGHRAIEKQVKFITQGLRPKWDVFILGTPKRIYLLAYKDFYVAPDVGLWASEPLSWASNEWYKFSGIHQLYDRGKWMYPTTRWEHYRGTGFTRSGASATPTTFDLVTNNKGVISGQEMKLPSGQIMYCCICGKTTATPIKLFGHEKKTICYTCFEEINYYE